MPPVFARSILIVCFAAVLSAGLLTLPTSLRAACSVRPSGSVTCATTRTSNSTNADGNRASSSDREQSFDNGNAIDATVGAGIDISGAGLDLSQMGGRNHPAAAIGLVNDGTISASGVTDSLGFHGNGAPIVYSGAGSVTSSDGTAIFVRNQGPVMLTLDGTIVGGIPAPPQGHQKLATPPGVQVEGLGYGDIVVGGAGNVVGQGGRGIWAEQTTGMGGVTVTGTGDTAGRGVICPGVADLQYALSKGKTGCSGIRAVIDSPGNASAIRVDRSGNISGTSTAINAITFGRGDVLVATGRTAQITGVSEFGIEAAAKGAESSGSIHIVTGANGAVSSGGNGIFAVNNATRIGRSRDSAIWIDASGTIESGSFALAALNDKNPTGVLGGISAGYVGGSKPTFNQDVYGSLFIDDKALITAIGGDGVVGYNFGRGPISVHVQNSVIARAGNGISTTTASGPTDIVVTGATVTASGAGHAAVLARSIDGTIDVAVDPTSTLRGQNGAFGIELAGPRSTVVNRGVVEGGSFSSADHGPRRGVAITGVDITLVNSGTVSGGIDSATGVTAYAVVFTGGTNQVANTGVIESIHVAGSSSFAPALPNSTIGSALALQGPLRFASTSRYAIRLSPTASDSVQTTGTATLGGAQLSITTGGHAPPVGRRYTILSAAQGISSHFGSVVTDLAFLQPIIHNDDVHLSLTTSYDFSVDAPANAAAVGRALNQKFGQGGSQVLFDSLERVPAGQGISVLNALSGDGITAARNTAHRSGQLFDAAITDETTFYGANAPGNSITLTDASRAYSAYAPTTDMRRVPLETGSLQSLPTHEYADLPSPPRQPEVPIVVPDRTWRAWATGVGSADDIRGNAATGSAAQDNAIYGGVLGVDYQLTPNHLVGVSQGGTNGVFSVPGRTTSGSTTGGHIAIYDIVTLGRFYAASETSFSYFTNRTSRLVSGFGTLVSEIERGTFASHEVRTRLEFGRHFTGAGATITPIAAIEVADLRANGFNEQGISGPGIFALNVGGQSTYSLPFDVGARLQRVIPLGSGMILTPTLELAYVHEFAPIRLQAATLIALPGATFLVDGARAARDAAHIKAGGALAIGLQSFLFADFDGEIAGVEQSYGGRGGFRFLW